jgi:hypothetical protein
MEFKSTISKSENPEQIVYQLTGRCGSDFDMGVLFITPHQKNISKPSFRGSTKEW